jgi:hypothetical protein
MTIIPVSRCVPLSAGASPAEIGPVSNSQVFTPADTLPFRDTP